MVIHAKSDEAKIASLKRARDAAKAAGGTRPSTSLTLMELKSPLDGVINYMPNYSQGWMNAQPFKVGDHASPGGALAEIPDLRTLEMESKVDEVDRGRIAVGEQCWCTWMRSRRRCCSAKLDSHLSADRAELQRMAADAKLPGLRATGKARPAHAARDERRRRRGRDENSGCDQHSRESVVYAERQTGRLREELRASTCRTPVQSAARENPDEVAVEGIAAGDVGGAGRTGAGEEMSVAATVQRLLRTPARHVSTICGARTGYDCHCCLCSRRDRWRYWYGTRAYRKLTGSKEAMIPTAKGAARRCELAITARGELRGGNPEVLTAPMTGGATMHLTYCCKTTGEEVKTGDVVVQFDTTEQEFKLKEAEADLAEAAAASDSGEGPARSGGGRGPVRTAEGADGCAAGRTGRAARIRCCPPLTAQAEQPRARGGARSSDAARTQPGEPAKRPEKPASRCRRRPRQGGSAGEDGAARTSKR